MVFKGRRVGVKLLASIAAIELMRGIFVVSIAALLAQFIAALDQSLLPTIFAMLLAKIAAENLRARKFNQLSAIAQSTVRKKLHAAIFNHDSRPPDAGELLTLIFDTAASLDNFITRVLPTIAALIVLTPLILIVAAVIDPLSAMIFFATLPIAPFLLYLIGKAIGERNARAQLLLIELNADFTELLRAITTLKIFRRTEPAVDKLRAISERSTEAILDVLKLAFVSAFALELITTLAIAIVAVTAGLRLTTGAIEFRAAFFILLLAPEFFAPIRQLGAAFHSFIDAKQSLEKLRPLLAVEIKPRGSIVKTKIPPSITLDNVSFTYPNKLTPALENLNLSIDAGKITVIKGESGCGKSTLLKLLAGINRPTSGEIFINDLPLSKAERRSLVEKIAYVPQQPHHFISNVTGIENGAEHTLSRGQLQRLGLLRAERKIDAKNSSIVILDEPTAGLDPETERAIIDAIKKAGRRRTVIIAAHRPAILQLADAIIDLDSMPAVAHRIDGNVGNERDRIGVVGE